MNEVMNATRTVREEGEEIYNILFIPEGAEIDPSPKAEKSFQTKLYKKDGNPERDMKIDVYESSGIIKINGEKHKLKSFKKVDDGISGFSIEYWPIENKGANKKS